MKYQTQEEDIIEVEDDAVTKRMLLFQIMMIDLQGNQLDQTIPKIELPTNLFNKVIAYCTSHKNDDPAKPFELPESLEDRLGLLNANPMDPVSESDRGFVDVTAGELIKLFQAADYLDVPDLRDLCLRKFASQIKDQDPEGVKAYFGVDPQFDEGEMELFEKEKNWAQNQQIEQ